MRTSLAERYAGWVVRRRVAVIIALIATTFALGRGLWDVKPDPSLQRLYPRTAAQLEADAAFGRTFGNTDNVVAILVEADDVTRPDVLAWIHELTLWLRAQAFADYAVGITTYPFAYRVAPPSGAGALADVASGRLRVGPVGPDPGPLRAALAANPLVDRRLIAADRSVALTAVQLRDELRDYGEVEPALAAIARRVREVPPPAGARARITGAPHVRVGLIQRLEADKGRLILAAVAIVIGLMVVIYRWYAAVLFPCWTVGMAAIMTAGAMGWLGVPFDMVSSNVPIIVLVVGISDSVHYMLRYGDELAAGHPPHEASRRTLAAIASACLITSATTAAGFASLAVSDNQVVWLFGVASAIGIMVAYAATITFLPARLATVKAPRRPLAGAANRHADRFAGAVAAWCVRRRGPVLAAAGVAFALSIAGAMHLRRDSTLLDNIAERDEMRDAFGVLEAKLGGVRPLEVSLRADFRDPALLDAIDRVQAWARAQPGVLQTTSHTDFLRAARFAATGDPAARGAPFGSADEISTLHALVLAAGPRRIVSYATDDLGHLRVQIMLADAVSARQTIAFAARVRERVRAELPGVEAALTGEALASSRGIVTVSNDLASSVALAVLVIVALMAGMFRSAALALLIAPPCMLPIVLTMAGMYVRGIPLNPGNITVFAACAGLAVDGAVHMVARYQEELRGGRAAHDAIATAARATGRANIYTYLGLAACVSVFQLSSFPPLQRFGALMTMTVLGCLVTTLVLLPAVLTLRRTS